MLAHGHHTLTDNRAVKSLRILVLVLLAVLLPVRGAFAGAMWCASHGAAHGALEIGAEVDDVPLPHALKNDHAAMGHDHGGMAHDHAAMHGSHHGHDERPADGMASATCQFCASGCCMASIVATVPAIGPAPLTARATFPPLIVPAPAFESDGPERPPRIS
jgi:hypothetical protein